MKYDIKEAVKKYDNPLIDVLVDYNKLSEKEVKQLFQSALFLSSCDDECVLKAIARLKQAKKNNEAVFIGGDYDADGICATTIMKDTLDIYGIKNGYYIPDRLKEGYGLNKDKVLLAYERGYRLIVTVDNGVKAYEALATARELNMDVIITDHHLIEKDTGFICVHPDYMDKKYKALCGAGVALQISRNLIGNNDFHTALACIATIGDVMPLLNENRNIVNHGLKILNRHQYKVFDILSNKEVIDVEDIAFTIVPKLNALGRLADMFNPNDIIRYYFLEKNPAAVLKMGEKINKVNDFRKQMSKSMSETAITLVKDDDFIVIESESFHEGIVGLIAGKLASAYHKPAIVLSNHNGILKGSGRSIRGFDLHGFLNMGFDELLTFGGHAQAVGLSLKKEDFNGFYEKVINKYYAYPQEEVGQIVYKIELKDLTVANFKQLSCLKPLGEGVKLPLFIIDVPDNVSYQLLKGLYPKYVINDLEAISFDRNLDNKIVKPKLIVGELSINRFNGKERILINIKDIE